MRSIQAVRVCAAAAIVSAALVFVPGAGAGITPLPLPGPAVAVSGNRAAVAWTADGVVQLATLQADGTFSAGEGVGRTLDGRAPQLALTPAGDELLIWQSGGVLRSASRTAGHDAWTYETVASGLSDYEPPQLVVGSDGRATAAWEGVDDTVHVSTRSANGWGAPMMVAPVADLPSLAVDSAGDVALVFVSQGTTLMAAGVWATVAAGASAWTAPVLVSGADAPSFTYQLRVDGGGARTFVATWSVPRQVSAQNAQPLIRSARLRIPGTWQAPQVVVLPTLDPALASTGFAGEWASGVDGLGNALAVVRFPTLAEGSALAATTLGANSDVWTGPVTTDFPAARYSSDSAPGLAVTQDGSATVAFVRSERDNFQMRIATAAAPFTTWLGQSVGLTFTGPNWEYARPVVAADGQAGAIALQSTTGDLVAFARNAPSGTWTGPQTLKSTGGTTGYLAGAHVKRGVAQIVVRCGLPPCQGVVLLQAALRSGRRQLARVSFSFAAAGTKNRPISLPAWARARMRHGRHLLTHFALTVREGDGTSEQVQRTIRLHG